MLEYDFGPQHPLRPERLRRAIELAQRLGFDPIDPGPGSRADIEPVHDSTYIDYVETANELGLKDDCGFGPGDNPRFPNMFRASLAYCAGSVAAARCVADGEPLAINLSGGLHHARAFKASGFCIFNDLSAAIHVLRSRFDRVAYVDVDVHHGDGVQFGWWDDQSVLTCSIHQDGRTIYPGTGWVDEVGPTKTAVNVPLWPGTTGDTWLWAFDKVIIRALQAFEPQAIVLQMGTDAHPSDKLGRLNVSVQDFLEAVAKVKALGRPIVATGGGGYNLQTVPRMWVGACQTLAGSNFDDALPEDLAAAWDTPTFRDAERLTGEGMEQAEAVVRWHERFTL